MDAAPNYTCDHYVGMPTFTLLSGRLSRFRARRRLYRTRLQYFDIALGFPRWRVNLARECFMKVDDAPFASELHLM
jgi:hypothetical protein